MDTDLYEILGVDVDASQAEIKAAYKSLAQKHHPDRGGGDHGIFQAIQKAYEVLSDPERQAKYDATGNVEFNADSAAALNMLGSYFKAVLQNWDGVNDPVTVIRGMAQNALVNTRNTLVEGKKLLKNLDKIETRFKFNGDGVNVFQNILDKSRGNILKQIGAIDKQIARIELALELLNDYEGLSDLVKVLQNHSAGTSGNRHYTATSQWQRY